MRKILLLSALLCFGISMQAQSNESKQKEKDSILNIFKKKDQSTNSAQPNKSGKKVLKDARSDHRDAKKENKAAFARERAAREQLDLLKADRKADQQESRLEEKEAKKPILSVFKKDDSPEAQKQKTELKTARREYKYAKKERKVSSAKEREAREKVDLLRAQKKVEGAEKRADKAEERVEKVKNQESKEEKSNPLKKIFKKKDS